MKRIFQIVFIIVSFTSFAQHKIAEKINELKTKNTVFKPISVLNYSDNKINEDVKKAVDEATLATLDISKNNEVVTNQYEYIQLAVPFQNKQVDLLLYKVNPFLEGFHVDTDKGKNIPYQKGVYYRGIIKGDMSSIATFNFFKGECNGLFSSEKYGNIVIGKLKKNEKSKDYIIYSDTKLKTTNDFDCHVKENGFVPKPTNQMKSTQSTRCASVYFEIDYDLFQANSSDSTTTTNWMTSVFNNTQTLYNNDGISVGLKSIFIWTTLDPYQGVGTTSSAYLQAFHTNTPSFDGDVGQLVGIDPGGLGGVAVAIDGLCSDSNYSYADVNFSYSSVPTFSWTIEVITHELGHLLGSPHTHGCYWNGNNTAIDGCGPTANAQYTEGTCTIGPIPASDVKGTIMSYCHLLSNVGINLANGFGPQPGTLILNTVNNSTCLSSDCINTCFNRIVDITLDNVTTTSVTFSWTDSGNATSWEVSVTPFSSTNIVWNTTTNTSFTVTGLTQNSYYIIRIRPLCSDSSITPPEKNQIFSTNNSNRCYFQFTDTGGASSNYTNLENWTRTMLPTGQGQKIKVTFTSFRLENNFDYLYIYNGTDAFFPEMTGGGLTGTTLPSPASYTSTDPSGALTFKFVSDQLINDTGWIATITCTGSLGIESSDFIDFSYYPNPTNGKVLINSKDLISEIMVYNVEGQLLFNQKPNELDTSVDISAFASGTYFFKLKCNGTEANFKVLKD